jgi:hypothetical protein
MSWLIYVVAKWLAYVAWCQVGLRLFRSSSRPALALGLGTVRLLLGIGFGVAIFFGINMLATLPDPTGGHSAVPLYLLVYVPTRWLEWSIMFGLIQAGVGVRAGLFGVSSRDRLWRLGGIALSCCADIPIILSIGGLPLGRFLC